MSGSAGACAIFPQNLAFFRFWLWARRWTEVPGAIWIKARSAS